MKQKSLTEGSVVQGFILFVLPLMAGQLLQQLYNVADAWVVGNFADNASFAAVSSGGNLAFLIVGFFSGLSVGAGVIIARYYGARDGENVVKSIHSTVLFGIFASAIATVLTSIFIPRILILMKTPDSVLPLSIGYFRIYCAGISTIIMYNMFMAIMRALGDSLSPLFYLCISSVMNVALDLLFVAVYHKGVYGAALATVISQGVSALLCLVQMQRSRGFLHIYLHKLKIDPVIIREIILQGLPAGIQYSALSLGNVVVQSYVNSFGEYAMAGLGAHVKVEGFVFIPVICISTAMATFVSQNLGARQWERVKKGFYFGIASSLIIAQLMGIVIYHYGPTFFRFFTSSEESIAYGTMYARRLTIFYTFLAFTHGASGFLQGMGKSIISMGILMSVWCLIRILYVTIALAIRPEFQMIVWAYPITWMISASAFAIIIIRMIWKKNKE